MDFSKLTFDRIKEDVQNIRFIKADSYILSYPEFIKYFQLIDGKIVRHHLFISSHFVYGWMPTIIDLDTSNIDNVLRLLNEVKSAKKLASNELDEIKKCINNSMVGASKLLHFINPKEYAIWDSRVVRYITGNKSSYGIDNSDNYKEYLDRVADIINADGFTEIQSSIVGFLNYPITPMRAIELIMFQTNKKTAYNTTQTT